MDDPYDTRAVVTGEDPNVILWDLEGRGMSADAVDVALDLFIATSEPEPGTYTCRMYRYGDGVIVAEATITV